VLIIDENRNGETIAAAIGDAIEVRLAENATTGFRWKLISPCAPACAITGETRRPAATAAPGAGGEHHWQLQASAAGECEFKAEYRRHWEDATAPAREFAIRIRVSA
jgi:inhibitor of cysteine peptidase